MNRLHSVALPILGLIFLLGFGASRLRAQYTLDELGISGGGGFALFPNLVAPASGPGFNANAFYSHYFCGKNYGIHFLAGGSAFLPSYASANELVSTLPSEKLSMTLVNLELGAFGKVRLHEYHRPRETALFIGPKVLLPLMSRYSAGEESGVLRDVAKVSPVQVGAHLSLQIRRPAPEKKSWFIEPGVDYYFIQSFNSNPGGDVRNLYISLNFGFAFWDQRG